MTRSREGQGTFTQVTKQREAVAAPVCVTVSPPPAARVLVAVEMPAARPTCPATLLPRLTELLMFPGVVEERRTLVATAAGVVTYAEKSMTSTGRVSV